MVLNGTLLFLFKHFLIIQHFVCIFIEFKLCVILDDCVIVSICINVFGDTNGLFCLINRVKTKYVLFVKMEKSEERYMLT